MSQWGRWVLKRPRGRASRTGDAERVFEEAILDFVSFDPSSLRHLYLDCTVRNALGKLYLEAGSSDAPGVDMRLAVEQKAKRYPDMDGMHCCTAAIDQYGFLGSELHITLGELAAQATANDAAHARPPCDWLKKWLRQLSTAMAKVQATAILQSTPPPGQSD